MRKMNKKGFTIVELVIVIAVIAILAAVLIPTYSSLVKKANVSKDTQLIKNLNTALAADQNKHNTMTDALDAAAEFGYDVAKINASATDNEILWDSVNDVFCYYDADAQTVKYISEVENNDVKDYQYWKIYTEMPTQQTYSIYWNAENTTIAELSVGFDCGKFASDLALTYKGGETAKTVTFRTSGGTLTIDAENDDVYHYGSAAVVNVQAVASSSYHANGTIGLLNVTKGHVVVEENGTVSVITKSEGATGTVDNKGTINTSMGVEVKGKEPEQKHTTSTATTLVSDDKVNSGYIKLGADETVTTANGITMSENTVIDLNGHTLKFDLTSYGRALKVQASLTIVDTSESKEGKIYFEQTKGKGLMLVENGSLTLNSGTIEAKVTGEYENAAAIKIQNATLIMNGGAIIASAAEGKTSASAVYIMNNSKCYINGGQMKCQDNAALTGNGNYHETYIEINGGIVKSTNGGGIYHPQVGVLNINGGYIEGYSAVYQKAGTMTITGGVFKATGAKKDYKYNGNGATPTGDCIIIDSCKGYGNGATVANILLDSTKIISANAKAVAGYIYGTDAAAVIIWNGEQVTSIEVEN